MARINSNGLLLLQICTELKHHHILPLEEQITWFHLQSKHSNVVDCIICKRGDVRNFCKIRVVRSADSETDHLMVRAEIKFSFRRKFRFYGVKAPKRIYVSKLKDPVVRISLKDAYQQVGFSDSY